MCGWSENCERSKSNNSNTWSTWPRGVIKVEECSTNTVFCVFVCVGMCNKFFHEFTILQHRSLQTDRKGERERFMNGLQGSDLVAGTGTDMLTAEEEECGGEGAQNVFKQKKSRNAWRNKVGEWGWIDERMEGCVAQTEEEATSSLLNVLVPSYVICLGKM